MKKIVRRIKELMFDRTITKRGNYEWKDGLTDSIVVWRDDPVNGKWLVSQDLNPGEDNQRITEVIKDMNGNDKTVYRPLNPNLRTGGADPYKFMKTEGKRLSNGGGCVFVNRDKTIDPDDKPIREWSTFRTVCTYSARPADPDAYAEDMLKMCVFWGSMMYPEINIPLIWNYFVRRGYDGYLKYMREPNGQWRKTPGFNMKGAYPQRVMQLHQNYIAHFSELEHHIEILYEAKKIKGVEDLTNFDLFVAVGAAYMGSEINYGGLFDNIRESNGPDISDFY
jgi:hypothetical protein